MVDERADEEIVELTEDMASVPPPPPDEDEKKKEEDSSVAQDKKDDEDDDGERPSTPPIGGKFTLMDDEDAASTSDVKLSNPPPPPVSSKSTKKDEGEDDESVGRVSDTDIEEVIEEDTEADEESTDNAVETEDESEIVEFDEEDEEDDDEEVDDEEVEIDEADTEEIDELDSDVLEEEDDHEEEEINVDEIVEIPALPKKAKTPPKIAVKPKTKPSGKRRRRRAREWWSQIFDESYLSLVPKFTPRDIRKEADFIAKSLNLPKGNLLLDLACGNGRQAVAIAQRGYRVVGVDLSLPMLARAGEHAQEADQNINFIHGDMRDLGFEKTFDGIYCVGTSFGFFDDATNLKVLEGIRRALKPGAPFLLEVANRDFALDKAPNLTWFEGNSTVCLEEVEFNYISSRLEISRQIIMGDDTGRQMKHEYSLRLYSLHELGLMLHQAGLTVINVCGHTATPDAFFGVDSAQIIIQAQRRS